MPRQRQASPEFVKAAYAAAKAAKEARLAENQKNVPITYQDDEPSAILLGFIVILVAVCSFIGGCLTGTGYVKLYPILMGWLGQGG